LFRGDDRHSRSVGWLFFVYPVLFLPLLVLHHWRLETKRDFHMGLPFLSSGQFCDVMNGGDFLFASTRPFRLWRGECRVMG
jgi:hypothetical protein